MTETQFQATRKVMQKANYWRGIITTRKGEVARWTQIEGSHRENMQPGKADAAKNMIIKAIARLAQAREQFAAIKLPEE